MIKINYLDMDRQLFDEMLYNLRGLGYVRLVRTYPGDNQHAFENIPNTIVITNDLLTSRATLDIISLDLYPNTNGESKFAIFLDGNPTFITTPMSVEYCILFFNRLLLNI